MWKIKKENLKEYENLKAENIEFYQNELNFNLYFQDSKTKLKKNTINSISTTDSLKENLSNNIFEKIEVEKRILSLPNNSNDKKYELNKLNKKTNEPNIKINENKKVQNSNKNILTINLIKIMN